jgi:hypothetical protein
MSVHSVANSSFRRKGQLFAGRNAQASFPAPHYQKDNKQDQVKTDKNCDKHRKMKKKIGKLKAEYPFDPAGDERQQSGQDSRIDMRMFIDTE